MARQSSAETTWGGQPGKIDSPLDRWVEKVKWGKFSYKQFFEPQKVSCKLSKLDLIANASYPVYSSDSSNGGIVGRTNTPEYKCTAKCPLYIVFGDHTRTFNIVSTDFSVMDNVKVLRPKFNNIRILLFIISAWKKQIPNLGYARHWKEAKKNLIPLPVDNNGNIDFNFIESRIRELEESRIRELEESRIRELEAYLSEAGFDDCSLTAGELNALRQFSKKSTTFKPIKLGGKNGLFNITKGKRLTKENMVNGEIPFIGATSSNNGRTNFISNNSGQRKLSVAEPNQISSIHGT